MIRDEWMMMFIDERSMRDLAHNHDELKLLVTSLVNKVGEVER